MAVTVPLPRDRRGTSAVLDAVLCVLLVGAAAGTLANAEVSAGRVSGEPRADQVAEQLTTSTTEILYTDPDVAPDGVASGGQSPRHRTVRGTYAVLLAVASVRNATVGRTPVGPDGTFGEAVSGSVTRRVDCETGGVQVLARWRPYPGAPVGGTAVAGSRPPRTADVTAARVTVPSGFPDVRDRAIAAAQTDGYRGVAMALADALIAGWFGGHRARIALRGSDRASSRIERRYRRLGDALDVAVAAPIKAGESRNANSRLRRALADRLERDLRTRYDTPEAAARDVRIASATVTVRTWSA